MREPAELFTADWQELRTEVTTWEAIDEALRGYDGYTRYWCKEAVLGVFWIAEQEDDGDIEIMLSTEIDLEGFSEPLPFQMNEAERIELAEHVGWYDSATRVVQQMTDRQLSLFEGV